MTLLREADRVNNQCPQGPARCHREVPEQYVLAQVKASPSKLLCEERSYLGRVLFRDDVSLER